MHEAVCWTNYQASLLEIWWTPCQHNGPQHHMSTGTSLAWARPQSTTSSIHPYWENWRKQRPSNPETEGEWPHQPPGSPPERTQQTAVVHNLDSFANSYRIFFILFQICVFLLKMSKMFDENIKECWDNLVLIIFLVVVKLKNPI